MGDDTPSVEKIGGTIPLFFYDVIGHIFPGATLILGLAWYLQAIDISNWSQSIQGLFPKDASAGSAALIFLLFFGIANITGVFLKPISYHLIQKPTEWWIDPLSTEKLRRFLGLKDIDELKRRFRVHFGSELSEQSAGEFKKKVEDKSLNKASFLCSYYTMRTDPNLGLMTSRWDAELLSTQSLCLVVLFFTFLPFAGCFIPQLRSDHGWRWSISCLILFLFNYFAYTYLRQKRVFGRFALFLTVTAKDRAVAPQENKTV
ncbi:MAG: hypothetical protein LAO30_26055 [Acidobacteriia bacterium]|nr:hypothetical protein [Terriglobia bacterium]